MQIDVGVIKDKVAELKKQSDRIENKLDNLSTVSQEDYKKFVQYVEDTFVKRESIKGLKAVGYAVLTALSVSATLGLAKLLGARL